MYTMGGHLDAPQPSGLTDPGRFGDKIYRSGRLADGTYTPPVEVVGKAAFPWMSDEAFLAAHPEAFIGSVGGPVVLRLGDAFRMLFAASVSDPNVCTGEHRTPTPHGSCTEPWSFFAMFSAVSQDGIAWQLVNSGRPNNNVALQRAALYYEPTVADIAVGEIKGISGIAGCVMLEDDDWWHIPISCWSSLGQRNALLQTTDFLDFDLWTGRSWEAIVDGRLPQWLNGDLWRGNTFAHIISSVAVQTSRPGYRFILTAEPNGNQIEVAYSNDLTSWTAPEVIMSDSPTLNGTGPAGRGLVVNSRYVEDATGRHVLFASNDANGDGQPDCGSTYAGLAIYRADVVDWQVASGPGRRRPSTA
jgi:hypothetical protein